MNYFTVNRLLSQAPKLLVYSEVYIVPKVWFFHCMLLNQTIRLFLDSIGRREEYEFYLNKFQSADTACFALLVPDFESLDQGGAAAFAFDLNFMTRLGLKSAVVLCGGDALARWDLMKDNPLFERVFFPNLGELEGTLPVFVDDGVSMLEGLVQKVPAIGKRIHFIRAAGGFLTDYYYTHKENSIELNREERVFADLAAGLLEARPGIHISVTSPINLLEEIFTVKGAGTVFRRGSTVLSGAADSEKLLVLLAESFERTPKEGVLAAVTHIYYEENYRGAVFLEQQPAGLYLSKFAVGPEARGEGLALELWAEVCKNHSAFFWRSRIENPVNQWYDRQADGRYTTNKWMIFWRGMPSDSLPGLIRFCQNRTPDFLSV